MKKITGSFIALISIILVIGFLSGIVGELWLNSFLMPNSYINFKSYSDLSYKLDRLLETQNKTKNIKEQDFIKNEAINKVRPVVVSIYRDKKFSAQPTSTLVSADYLGQGIIITSDGWVVSHLSALKSEKNDFWVVTNEQQILKTEQVVADENTGVVFLKVSASGLPVAEFNLKENLVANQDVFVFGPDKNVIDSSFKEINASSKETTDDLLRESEVYYKFIELNEQNLAHSLGSPVVSLDGRVSGLVIGGDGLVMPLDHLIYPMRAITKNETWTQPYLGIKFYDLSELLNPEYKEKQGALIAVIANTSPAKGVFSVGDIIVGIEKEELTAKRNLSELLASYHSGDVLVFKIKRGNEIKEVKVTLGGDKIKGIK